MSAGLDGYWASLMRQMEVANIGRAERDEDIPGYSSDPYVENLTRFFAEHEDHARKCQMACQDMKEAIEAGFPGLVAPYIHELIELLPKGYIK